MDGASYHCSQEVKDYLALTNYELDKLSWEITCIHFEPNAPKQNPIEDIWGYRLSNLFVGSIIYANLLRQLSSFSSLFRIDKSLTFPSFLPMTFSQKLFRIAILPLKNCPKY